ncbi:hypothetical protein GGU11DRAFT_756002 [Lentinula aff. detonsa]|uniref:Uncharacterized protein n=1 Tax=Lentinula aff. detonsa TaxID=2804958 RepID=A0AA38NM99_9AGAR|nr:hypothetical protein GGU10DRAFT_332412 [Lentinula aff. detonsa]KAJ3798402.1 hypothetical protein GGU11DRAFT_756002 [Lentinula aff. detonsa]
MHNNAKASGSKRRLNDDGNDERRRPRKRMEDRKKERLARLHQKLRMRKVIVRKEEEKEQRDEEDDKERQKECILRCFLLPVEEPPMPLASRSDFPSDHWVEPTEEHLDLSPSYPKNHVSVVIPPLPSSSPPADGPVIGAPRIPRCTSCAKRRIKCADDETLAARNAHLAKGKRVGRRRGKVVEEVEEDDEEDHDQVDVQRVPRMGLRECYPRGAQSLDDHILIETRRIGEQQEMTLRVIDRMEERQERIESKLARIARLLEAKGNKAKAGSEGEESEVENKEDVDE